MCIRDRNLVRADLTEAESADHYAKRKALYLKLHPETKQGGAPGKAGGGKKAMGAKMASFVKDTAKKTGKAKRTIARKTARGEAIDPQALDDVKGTCLDNGTELDALAKLPAAEQRSLAEAAKRGETVSAITARSACDSGATKMSDGTEEMPMQDFDRLAKFKRRIVEREAVWVCEQLELAWCAPVSYTHLDVYKRQGRCKEGR